MSGDSASYKFILQQNLKVLLPFGPNVGPLPKPPGVMDNAIDLDGPPKNLNASAPQDNKEE
jgi:hypothetical protein